MSLTLWSAADLSIVAGSALAERRDFVKGACPRLGSPNPKPWAGALVVALGCIVALLAMM
jgi:hypothetical protein